MQEIIHIEKEVNNREDLVILLFMVLGSIKNGEYISRGNKEFADFIWLLGWCFLENVYSVGKDMGDVEESVKIVKDAFLKVKLCQSQK